MTFMSVPARSQCGSGRTSLMARGMHSTPPTIKEAIYDHDPSGSARARPG